VFAVAQFPIFSTKSVGSSRLLGAKRPRGNQ
jgi:hypothetical protein